ncbi:MAG: PQQ-binding-like beta-propeller repeat protein, partial [Planctomycetales bacterium]|nr:PQQ-binding-like beta-propeller repeat protein [Planctomycetales bacterium]
SFNAASGEKIDAISGGQIAATPEGLVRHLAGKVTAYRWIEGKTFDRRGNPQAKPTLEAVWELAGIAGGSALMVAGEDIISGGEGKVTVIDRVSRKPRWSTDVRGIAYGLAVLQGRLLVSTSEGRIYCFGDDRPSQLATATPIQSPYDVTGPMANIAQRILAHRDLADADLTDAYCVDLGCGDGALSYHLARLSKLRIYAVESDPELAKAAREKLTQAGVYGQVIVHTRPLDATGYPKYFADLIVSGRQATEPKFELPVTQVQRMQRPCGGVVCRVANESIVTDVRGPLPGAGDWTHQYSSASNTLNSGDDRIRGRLSMLWYRDVSFDIPQRHGRAPAPLYSNGRLFHAGLDGVVAVDAYNGRELWRREIKGLLDAYDGDELMGTAGTGSNFCVEGDSLYVRDEGHCLQLDVTDGRVRNTFSAPTMADGKPGTWGYVAAVDGLLFGSLADREHVVTYRYVNRGGNMNQLLTESLSLFATDGDSGDLKWRYDAKDSIRHNAIAIANGRVFLIDRPQALFDREKKPAEKPHPTGSLVCIDTTTGKELWRNDQDIYGTLLSYSPDHETLLMSYQPTRFRLDSEFGGRMAAFDARTGKRRWDIKAEYQSRPMINGDLVYAQGGTWELLTGKPRPFDFTRSYGCGVLAGSKHMMLFRSATLGYFNVGGKETTENFGGVRPGCWINAIPAGGIVMVPDASSGCQCSYLNKAWFALDSDTRVEPVLKPDGGPSNAPLQVTIEPDPDATAVRYTLDGSTPDASASIYESPLTIGQTATLKARSFYEDGSGGPVATGQFEIDPNFLPLTGSHWSTWDTAGPQLKEAPSVWKATNHEVTQSSNIHEGDSGAGKPTDRRDGTLRIYRDPDKPFANGVFTAQIRSTDNDGIGFAFRVAAPDKLYLLAMDAQRKFQVLAVRDGNKYRVLDQNAMGYTPNRWHNVRIEAQGSSLKVFVDGEQTLQATDETISAGGVALYSWGNSGVSFRALKIARP